MSHITDPELVFPESSLNKVVDLPPYQPYSAIDNAITLLCAVGEEKVVESQLSIIPIDLTGKNSVVVKFKKPVDPTVSREKGLDHRVLRIQRLSETNPSVEQLDQASSKGFDTGHNALIASMDGTDQAYFSNDPSPSSQRVNVVSSAKTIVEVPLYVPIIFFGPNGKKCVALVTRFPKHLIDVGESKSIDSPIGVMTVDDNKIVRKSPPVVSVDQPANTFKWAFEGAEESPVENNQPIPIPTLPVDGRPDLVKINFAKIEEDRAAGTSLDDIIDRLGSVKNTRPSIKLMATLNNIYVDREMRRRAIEQWKVESKLSSQPLDSPAVLYAEIVENIAGFQELFEKTEHIGGGWLSYQMGGFADFFSYVWKVDTYQLDRSLKKYEHLYRNKSNPDRRQHFIEYASLSYLLNSEWVAKKSWKN